MWHVEYRKESGEISRKSYLHQWTMQDEIIREIGLRNMVQFWQSQGQVAL